MNYNDNIPIDEKGQRTPFDQVFAIVSVKHTLPEREHILFWMTNHRGYSNYVGNVGLYSHHDAKYLNDGEENLAVVSTVLLKKLLTEMAYTPYCNRNGKATRFYDGEGLVLNNCPEVWEILLQARLEARPDFDVDNEKLKRFFKKNTYFKKRERRSFALPNS